MTPLLRWLQWSLFQAPTGGVCDNNSVCVHMQERTWTQTFELYLQLFAVPLAICFVWVNIPDRLNYWAFIFGPLLIFYLAATAVSSQVILLCAAWHRESVTLDGREIFCGLRL